MMHAGLPFTTLYCSRGDRPAVEMSLKYAAVTPSEAGLWISTLDGTQQVPDGAYPTVAVQYAGESLTGGHFDLSVVYLDYWPGVDPAPEEDMKGFIVIGSNGSQWAVLPNGTRFGIASQQDLAVLQASGQFVSTGQTVSDAQLAQWPEVGAYSGGFPNHLTITVP